VHARSTAQSLLALLVALLVVACTALVGVSPASGTTTREARLLEKINHVRATHGLPPLHASEDLMVAARRHTSAMIDVGALFHTASFTALCCWRAVGENVTYGYSVRGVHRQFMGSPPHRANILDPGMNQVGVGIIERAGTLWVTEVFRDPS
jgi:uncharacterized protein YkwD